MLEVPQHPDVKLSPSEVVTLALLPYSKKEPNAWPWKTFKS
jgi:hypothetical protein